MRLVLASANPDKAAEIRALLGDFELLPRPPEVPDVVEDGATLRENARLKAMALALATGEPAVADDTGLEVDALGGAPGIWAARYAGEDATYSDNVALLLAELDRVGAVGVDRRARFRTVALVAWPDGAELAAEGVVEGRIVEAPRGAAGFGYDPVFAPLVWRGAHLRRARPGGQGRRVPPRPRLPGPRHPTGRHPGPLDSFRSTRFPADPSNLGRFVAGSRRFSCQEGKPG